jgi:hypothetical protein
MMTVARTIVCAAAMALALGGCGGNDDHGGAPDLAIGDDLAPAEAADLAAGSDLTVAHDLATPCAYLDGGIATELRCTGLYDDWSARHVDAANQPFKPGFELWSDGAQKSRWIYLPPGKAIDVSNMNEWVFPVGTKLWKEFRLDLGGTMKKVETRVMEKLADGSWDMQTYVWSDDQANATLQATPIVPFPGTASYEVPAGKCAACHNKRADKVLGFEAVLMAAPEATGLTWAQLQATGRLASTNGNETIPAASLHLLDGANRPVERNGAGYVHANCGIMCHKPGGGAPFSMRITVDNTAKKTPDDVTTTDVFLGAINQTSGFRPPAATGNYYRIRPTDDTRSTIYYRMGQRDQLQGGAQQMPPLDTHATDAAGLGAIDSWINYMTTANGYPAPAQ